MSKKLTQEEISSLLQNLTEVEIRKLLLSASILKAIRSIKLKNLLNESLKSIGIPYKQDKPEKSEIFEDYAEYAIYSLISQRLLNNDRTIPLISSKDLKLSIFNETTKKGDNSIIQSIKLEALKERGTSIEESVQESKLPDEDSYDYYWRYVTAIIKVVNKYKVTLEEFLEIENVYDEIIKKMFDKKQFIARHSKNIEKTFENFEKILLETFEEAIKKNPSHRSSIEKLLKEIKTNSLKDRMKDTLQTTMTTWLAQEVARIYPET